MGTLGSEKLLKMPQAFRNFLKNFEDNTAVESTGAAFEISNGTCTVHGGFKQTVVKSVLATFLKFVEFQNLVYFGNVK